MYQVYMLVKQSWFMQKRKRSFQTTVDGKLRGITKEKQKPDMQTIPPEKVVEDVSKTNNDL